MRVRKTWEDYDAELKRSGWNLQLKRHYDEWTALYYHLSEIMRLTKGETPDEAVRKGYQLIQTGKLWEEEGE